MLYFFYKFSYIKYYIHFTFCFFSHIVFIIQSSLMMSTCLKWQFCIALYINKPAYRYYTNTHSFQQYIQSLSPSLSNTTYYSITFRVLFHWYYFFSENIVLYFSSLRISCSYALTVFVFLLRILKFLRRKHTSHSNQHIYFNKYLLRPPIWQTIWYIYKQCRQKILSLWSLHSMAIDRQ